MAFTEDSIGGSFNSTSPVSLVAGDANGRKIVKSVVICNVDNSSHGVVINFVRSGTFRLFYVIVAPNDSLVLDMLVVLADSNYAMQAYLTEGATATQPHFVATWAQHS
jgi:hypothetical protein